MKESEGQGGQTFHSLAFAALVEYVEEHRVSCDPKPLRLADLYASRLKEHGKDMVKESFARRHS